MSCRSLSKSLWGTATNSGGTPDLKYHSLLHEECVPFPQSGRLWLGEPAHACRSTLVCRVHSLGAPAGHSLEPGVETVGQPSGVGCAIGPVESIKQKMRMAQQKLQILAMRIPIFANAMTNMAATGGRYAGTLRSTASHQRSSHFQRQDETTEPVRIYLWGLNHSRVDGAGSAEKVKTNVHCCCTW